MARATMAITVNANGSASHAPVVPLNTSNTAATAAITAIGTASTTASESAAGVTTAIAAVQTLVTAQILASHCTLDLDLAVIKNEVLLNQLFDHVRGHLRSTIFTS